MEWNAIMPCNGLWKPMPSYEAGIVSHLRKWDAPPFIRIIWRHNGAMRQCAAWAAVFSGSCMSWPGEYCALQWPQGWKTDINQQNVNWKIQNQTKGGIHLVSHKKSALFYPLISVFDLIIHSHYIYHNPASIWVKKLQCWKYHCWLFKWLIHSWKNIYHWYK